MEAMSTGTDSVEWKNARKAVLRWLDEERQYVHDKWGESRHEIQLTKQDIERDVMMYVHRAFVLGIDTDRGQQALLKGFSTLNSYVEAMVRLYGLDFVGGTSSGEIRRNHNHS